MASSPPVCSQTQCSRLYKSYFVLSIKLVEHLESDLVPPAVGFPGAIYRGTSQGLAYILPLHIFLDDLIQQQEGSCHLSALPEWLTGLTGPTAKSAV